MDSKLKYFILFIVLIIIIVVIINTFPQLEFTVWFPIRLFLKNNVHFSFIIVTFFAFGIGLVTNLVSYKILDLPRLKRYQIEIKKHKAQEQRIKDLKEAGEQDKKLIIKTRRRKKYIEKIQREVASERMKPTLFTMVPFTILFIVLNGFIFPVPSNIIVAIFPFNTYKIPLIGTLPYVSPISEMSTLLSKLFRIPPVHLGGGIHVSTNYFFRSVLHCPNGCYIFFMGWYFICTFGFNSILQRVMGLNLEM